MDDIKRMGTPGQPKYKLNDIVTFEYLREILTGKIYIVDAYGTFEQNEEPSYDIMVDDESSWTLYKHVRESWIVEHPGIIRYN